MPDIAEIIDHLKVIWTWAATYSIHDVDCPKIAHYVDDAIRMLEAQEPVEPKMMESVDEGVTWEKYEVPTCGVCGALLADALFCPMCGRAVKWG